MSHLTSTGAVTKVTKRTQLSAADIRVRPADIRTHGASGALVLGYLRSYGDTHPDQRVQNPRFYRWDDGLLWHRFSHEDLTDELPAFSFHQIRDIIARLLADGALAREHHHLGDRGRWDRTYSYRVVGA